MGEERLQELILAMSLERQEAIARRTDELLNAWRAFEPAPLTPFDTSAVALAWLALARDAVADIRRADTLPQGEPLQDEMVSPEAAGAPSPDTIQQGPEAQPPVQPVSLSDAALEGQAVPLTAGEADIVTIGGEIAMVASMAGGSADDEPVPAIHTAVQANVVTADVVAADVVAAETDDGVNAVVFEEAIILDDDLPFPMISPFEGDDASAALARAVSEGLALRTDHKPKGRDKGLAISLTIHPGSIPAYRGPPTSGTRLSSP